MRQKFRQINNVSASVLKYMANKQKHKYSLGFYTQDQIKALEVSATRRRGIFIIFVKIYQFEKININVDLKLLKES